MFHLIVRNISDAINSMQEMIHNSGFADVILYNQKPNDSSKVINWLVNSVPEMNRQKAERLLKKCKNKGWVIIWSGPGTEADNLANYLANKGLSIEYSPW